MTAISAIQEPTNAEKIRKLPWIIYRDAANTVFANFTFFGPVFVLFLSQLGLNNTQIGALLSLFPFLGLIAIFIAPRVARFGYKRTFVTFFGIRKFIAGFLLLVPWVLDRYGPDVTLYFVGAIVLGFGLCRAIAEVALYPWSQEYVPSAIRGKFSATNSIFSGITGLIAFFVASQVMNLSDDLERFLILFAVGLVFGGISVWSSAHTPGGAPLKGANVRGTSYRDMLKPLRDANFMLFNLGLAVITLGTVPMFSFLPLYMEEQIGLSAGNVVLLQTGTVIGSLSATYLMGWAADRYGSKPVLMSGVWLHAILPVCWLVMPRHSDWSLPVALIIAFVVGIAQITWGIGFGRLLFVGMVPDEQRTAYMAVFYAAIGLVGGVSQLIGGSILDLASDVSGELLFITLDPFSVLFFLGLVLTLISVTVFSSIQAESRVSAAQFANLFIHGNPLIAFESMIRYYRAKDEGTTLAMTERLGSAHSKLTVDELLEALNDPRFFVRFEAIVSIARTNPDPRFVEALSHILHGTEISLSVIAAWALGRIGDKHAIESLRAGLKSEYRSIRAHCARALGKLGDTTIIPLLMERLDSESDKGLQMAYLATLGSLKATQAIPTLLDYLRAFENEGARMELALSVSRIVGQEQPFIRLLRQIRSDPATACAQSVMHLKDKLRKNGENGQITESCADIFARGRLDEGTAALVDIINGLTEDMVSPLQMIVLKECATRFQEHGAKRIEYVLLALHVLEMALV